MASVQRSLTGLPERRHADAVQLAWVLLECVALAGRDPDAALVAILRDALIEVVGMNTRGRSGLRRLVLGSVAEAVVRAREVPVLLLAPASLASHVPTGGAIRARDQACTETLASTTAG